MGFSRIQPVELVNMCMITNPKNGKVLIQDKTDIKWKFGHSFPGGHVEPNETLLDAMIREVKEETGLVVSNLEACGTVEWFSDKPKYRRIGFLYKTSTFKGELISSDEGKNFWMNPDDLNEQNTAESLMKFIEIFNQPQNSAAYGRKMNGPIKLR